MRAWWIAALLIGCDSERRTPDDAGVMAADVAESVADAATDAARTIREACAEQRDIVCHDFERCATSVERLRYASEADCRARVPKRCEDEAKMPGVVDAVAQIDACTRDLVENGPCSRNRWIVVGLACGRPTRGTLQDGAKCLRDAQCRSGVCDVATFAAWDVCGTCFTEARVGDLCAHDGHCRTRLGSPHPLKCDRTAGRCIAASIEEPKVAEKGEPCDATTLCAYGLDCRDGLCVDGSLPLGADCSASACAPELLCHGAADGRRFCQRQIFVQIGDSCTAFDDDTILTSRWCRGEAYCDAGTCVASSPLGGACVITDPSRLLCGWSAMCAFTDGGRACVALTDSCR